VTSPYSPATTLRHAYPPGDEDDAPLMEVAEFHRHQFRVPVQGICIAHCGDKEHFPSALDFWLWSLLWIDRPASAKYWRLLAEEALCEPIDEQTYVESIQFNVAQLKRPPRVFVQRADGFVAAMRMYGGVVIERLRSSLLAEFDDRFVAFQVRVSL
jgi:hypothetical protein